MNKKICSLVVLMALTAGLQAKVRLHHLVSDNMVIQQQTDVRLWGWAKPGHKVVATTSWSADKSTAKVDKQGRWLLTVRSPKASYEPLSITFDDGDGQVTIQNVLAGEVWVCAGQSNMEMPVKGFGNCPVLDYNEEVLNAAGKCQVRSAKIPSIMRIEPQEDADTYWRECSPQTVGEFSATGYFCAKVLNKALDIPIGLIEANKGGTRVESWLTKENLEKYTNEPTDSMGIVNFKKMFDYHRAMLWGNGTFNPILNYTVKGILFYQGCSNVGDPGNQYSERLKLLVEQWRTQFGLGEIPFYFVQIAPYGSGDMNGTWNALLQEQQFRASQIIPNSGLVCTNDCVFLYESTQIHPAQKQKVGERLAFLALNKTYGMSSIICESPSYKDMKVKNDTIMLHLNNECGGISRFMDITGFEVAGADQVFHSAKAEHFWRPGGGYWNECIVVTCPEVKQPLAVRYCFRNWQLGNLANAGGLPLFPFRTDNW